MSATRSLLATGTLAAVLSSIGVGAAGAATGPVGDVTGQVFLDLDGDGTRDAGEPGRGDVPITLSGAATVVDATTTAADGTWSISGAPVGSYDISVSPPPGLARTSTVTTSVTVTDVEPTAVPPIGLGTTVTGPDLVVDVALVTGGSDRVEWGVSLANAGDAPLSGPLLLRVVVSDGLAVDAAGGGTWTCLTTASVATCERDGSLAAGDLDGDLTVTTTSTAAAGSAVSVIATGSGATFDAATSNDEDRARVAVGIDGVVDGVVDGGMPVTGGASPFGAGAAALAALLLGGAALAAPHRRP